MKSVFVFVAPEMVEELDGYINNTNISVFWIPPLVFNGELIGYVVSLSLQKWCLLSPQLYGHYFLILFITS